MPIFYTMEAVYSRGGCVDRPCREVFVFNVYKFLSRTKAPKKNQEYRNKINQNQKPKQNPNQNWNQTKTKLKLKNLKSITQKNQ